MKGISKYKELPVQVKASFWFLMTSFLQKGISTITTPIFTRVMTTADYGSYNVFNSWMSIITILVTMNMFAGMFASGLVKFSDDRKQFISSLQGLVLVMTIISTGIYMVLYDFWNKLLGLNTIQMLAMFVMIWTSSVFSFWAMEQKIDFKYKTLVIITVITSIAKPVLGVLAVFCAEDKVTARILSMMFVNIIGFSFLFFVHMKRGKVFYSKKYWKHAVVFCIPLIPHYLSSTILNSMDRIMIEKMVGASEAGIYSLAYSISLIMVMFNSSLLSTVEPWLYQKINNNKIADIGKVGYPVFVIVAIVNLGLIAFAPEVISIFAPPEYYEAIWIIPPVAMSVFFMFSYTMFAVFQFHFQKTKLIAMATMVGAIVNVVSNFFLIDIFGYIAAGYTTLLCYMLYSFAHYILMRKMCRDYLDAQYPYQTRVLLSIMGGFMSIGFLYLFTYQNIVYRYILTTLLFIVVLWKYKLIKANIVNILQMKREK